MFSQILRVTTDSGLTMLNQLDIAAQNSMNQNTYGYKSKRFEAYLTEWGTLNGTVRSDVSQGANQLTKRELDFAIQGQGYFMVTQPDGSTAYTRDGRFTINRDGFLVTQRGDMVGDGIHIPPDYEKFLILPDGTVQLKLKTDQDPQTVGRLTLAGFKNPEALKEIGDNKLAPTPESGEPYKIEGPTELKQGVLERANVDMYSQIDALLRMNASVIASYRLLKFTDDLYNQATNLKQ